MADNNKKLNPIVNMLQGVAMSIADSVPGVSGGTIAFILGYYDRFIGSIDDFFYEKGITEKRKAAFWYLVKYAIGWVGGFLVAAVVLNSIFESHIYTICSVFMGFVLAAIPVIIMDELKTIKGNWWQIVFSVIGATLVVLVAYFNLGSGNRSYDIAQLSFGSVIYMFVAGAIAICAMFLPGMSGSTLLLVFGLYIPIMTGVKGMLTGDFSAVPGLFVIGFGIIAGALTSVKGIRVCLDKFRSQTVYFIIGMLVGSLYAILLGPTTLEEPLEMMNFSTFNWIAFIIGVLVILGMEFGKKYFEKKKA